MRQGTSSEHYFETDAAQALRERRAAKAGNKHGNPIVLKSKLQAVIQDPTSASHVLVAESAGSVRRLNFETGETKQAYRGPTAPVTSAAVGNSAGKQTLFAGCWDKDIWSWDLASGATGRRYSGHSDFVKHVVAVVIGGVPCLISGGADKKIMVWEIESGKRLHVLQDQTVSMMAIQHLAVDPVESTPEEIILFSASSDPHIRRWRIRLDGYEQIQETTPAEPNTVRHAILEHDTTIYRLVFDLDGDEVDLWTASGDGTAKCLLRHKAFGADDTIQHGDHVRAVALVEPWVITAGRDEDIRVWDRASGKLYCTLDGHYDEVTDLLALPGGSRVLSVSIDGTVRVWPLAAADLDAFTKDQENRAKGIKKEEPAPPAEPLMTAEEEAELAALMEDDD
ncbi:WD40-repeat-containing domain protein [Microdochium trichocladiopsis]|uniref:WD40-repeat-containing domain protein n=1 Tax=Microdochium trichocladiopsis TaxID=1682393 RepID=A0A9P8YJA9_9PEZI|nr:WD40-repeat-containing domain protein [Microdochium trichocladiopsis]KAH7040441.1 WD40-repeat-containing domain protein [Microdochium trichocladiopsis]